MLSVRHLDLLLSFGDDAMATNLDHDEDMLPHMVPDFDSTETMAVVVVDQQDEDDHSPKGCWTGKVYGSQQALYDPTQTMHYILTVSPDLYQKLLAEVQQSQSIPCGLYFCCQGGDFGMHAASSVPKTRSSHCHSNQDDVVDIRLARWILVFVFVILALLSRAFPIPEDLSLVDMEPQSSLNN